MKRKILGILGALLICCASFGMADRVGATDGPEVEVPRTGGVCDGSFLGFRPWYQGLTVESGGKCEIVPVCEKPEGCGNANEKKLNIFVWTAVLNIMFDISLAIGMIAVGVVIYGGYLYIMSQGDPGKMTRGKKTLVSAVIGVAIAMGATVIVNTAKVILGINDANGWNQGEFLVTDVQGAFNWAYIAAGIVAVGFIIKNGVDYMLSTGDPGKTQKATRGLIFSVVGLVIVLLAAAITSFVISSIGGAM